MTANGDDRPPVPLAEDVVRYFGPGKIEDGVLVAGALILPPAHVHEMSCDRPAIYGDDLQSALTKIGACATIKLKKTGRFACLNVGAMIGETAACEEVPNLCALIDPVPEDQPGGPNPAHAVVLPMPDDTLISDLVLDLLRPLISLHAVEI